VIMMCLWKQQRAKRGDFDMFAVEFEADIQDGKVEIPVKYRKQLGRHVRVIILVDELGEAYKATPADVQESLQLKNIS